MVGFSFKVPPPLTPPLKGEGGLHRSFLAGKPRLTQTSATPSPLRGGVRDGGNLAHISIEILP